MTETGTKLSISFISQCNPDTKADRKDMSYEKVSDQGPVWVRFEDKIPGVFISTHDINFKLSEYSLDP